MASLLLQRKTLLPIFSDSGIRLGAYSKRIMYHFIFHIIIIIHARFVKHNNCCAESVVSQATTILSIQNAFFVSDFRI